jgi:ubiquinone/menaquinone biosynthesis C-methylase UbiE
VSSIDRAFAGGDRSAARWFAAQPGWWQEHYIDAVDQVVDFLAGDGVDLKGARVLDLGCGDGILTLGLYRRAQASSVVGIDLVSVDIAHLTAEAINRGVQPPQPDEAIEFVASTPDVIPSPDGQFDVVTSWSVFEHVNDPRSLLAEVRRVLRPGGLLFLQIWPLYGSEHGSHLWPWFDSSFVQHSMTTDEIRHHLSASIGDEDLAEAMFHLYESCNRITVDQLQAALVEAGFFLAKVELETSAFHVPAALQRYPISLLGISGVKILAVRH